MKKTTFDLKELLVRKESSFDFAEIYELIKNAFATAEVSDGDEQDYANALRQGEGYINDLALVAALPQEIVGHIMLTKIDIVTETQSFPALLLSPICVKLEYRNFGVGKLLIESALSKAKEIGFHAVFLVGDPKYYSRCGFVETSLFDITSALDIPAKYVQCRELTPDWLKNKSGIINVI